VNIVEKAFFVRSPAALKLTSRSHSASMQDGGERQQIIAFSELASLGAWGRPGASSTPIHFGENL
jgi:hypothetical protein